MQVKFHHQFHINSSFDSTFYINFEFCFRHLVLLKRNDFFCEDDTEVPITNNLGTNFRRIYTTFVLGTALQNSGTRANSFGHGPLDLRGKICSSFFNVDFWNGTPETRTALLNLCVPALM